MTGHQEHPGTGLTAQGQPARSGSTSRQIVRAVGVDDVQVVDAFDLTAVESALRSAIDRDAPSVVIARGACILKVRGGHGWATVDAEKCNGCAACVRTGCPAISFADGKARIDPELCVGERCAVCVAACPEQAISLVSGGAAMRLDFALVGVGGQGIVLASDLLAAVGLAAGFDVKKTDSLGMSQRGGSVRQLRPLGRAGPLAVARQPALATSSWRWRSSRPRGEPG